MRTGCAGDVNAPISFSSSVGVTSPRATLIRCRSSSFLTQPQLLSSIASTSTASSSVRRCFLLADDDDGPALMASFPASSSCWDRISRADCETVSVASEESYDGANEENTEGCEMKCTGRCQEESVRIRDQMGHKQERRRGLTRLGDGRQLALLVPRSDRSTRSSIGVLAETRFRRGWTRKVDRVVDLNQLGVACERRRNNRQESAWPVGHVTTAAKNR